MGQLVELNVYPSGFVGIKDAGIVFSEPKNQLDIANAVFNRLESRQRDFMIHSVDAMDAFALMNSRDPEKNTLDFVERILKLAVRHIGSDTDLLQWIKMQLNAQNTDRFHEKWLTETLGFVLKGWTRKVSPQSWCVMTVTAEQDKRRQTPMSQDMVSILGHALASGHATMTMNEFILNWIRRQGGLVDLINSLRVLYGTR